MLILFNASNTPTSSHGVKDFTYSSLQMEKEIKELKLQRDLAQSRLQDLLQVVGDNHVHVSKQSSVCRLP